jgi:hypothetical protein
MTVRIVSVCEVRDDDGMVAACGDAFVIKKADVPDGSVAGDPDGVVAPPGSGRAVLSPASAVADRERPRRAARRGRGFDGVISEPAPQPVVQRVDLARPEKEIIPGLAVETGPPVCSESAWRRGPPRRSRECWHRPPAAPVPGGPTATWPGRPPSAAWVWPSSPREARGSRQRSGRAPRR